MEGLGYKIYIDNYFRSPTLFDDPLTCELNSCGTVHWYRHGIP